MTLAISGEHFDDDGVPVITEAEFVERKRLRELKDAYKKDFEELKLLKSQVHYCQHLVDQCRTRLLQGWCHFILRFIAHRSVQNKTFDLSPLLVFVHQEYGFVVVVVVV